MVAQGYRLRAGLIAGLCLLSLLLVGLGVFLLGRAQHGRKLLMRANGPIGCKNILYAVYGIQSYSLL